MNPIVRDEGKDLAEMIRNVLPPYTAEDDRHYLCQLCERKQFKDFRKALKNVYRDDKSRIYYIMRRAVELYHCNEVLFEFCSLLLWLADDIISFKRYYAVKELPQDMAKIASGSTNYSNNALKYFVQTLEYLFACGYGGLEITIYGIYKKIPDDSVYYLTELDVSKELSCVYIIDNNNEYLVAKKCKHIKKAIDKSSRNDLRGLCYYYIGLAENLGCNIFKHKAVIEDCSFYGASGYMERSADLGFSLAKKYIKHHLRQNFVTSPEYIDSSTYADCEDSECDD